MDEPRSRAARSAAEAALVRLVHHYGATPEFVVLGGLVPDLLCSASPYTHVGTTDVDVQVDLEIQTGSEHAARLESSLFAAGFEADSQKSWRWRSAGPNRTVIKFELLADLDDQPAESEILFDGCTQLGAANLRGTGFAARDFKLQKFTGRVNGEHIEVDVRVAGLAGYLLAKTHAARSRRLTKDYYDIAFVLLNNDLGGVDIAAQMVRDTFPDQPTGATATALDDLAQNFVSIEDQGPRAYADQIVADHPSLQWEMIALDATSAMRRFVRLLQAPA